MIAGALNTSKSSGGGRFGKQLPLRSGRDQKDLNLDSSCRFHKGGGDRPPPTERESLACLHQAATRAGLFCKVELATSKSRTSGVPSTTFARVFSTSG